MLLVYVSKFYGFAHFEIAIVCCLQAHDKAEKCSFTCTIWTNHAHNAVRRKHEVEVVEKNFLAESLLHVLSFDNLITQSWTIRNKDFELLFTFFLLLVQHLFV